MVEYPEAALRLLNAREASAYLRISVSTLNRMESSGRLCPLRTPGGHRRYTIPMLNAVLGGNRGLPESILDQEAPDDQD